MVKGIPRGQEQEAIGYALWTHSDDGLSSFYNMDLGTSPNYIKHDSGISRTAVKAEAGASIIGNPVKSVTINLRKYGLPTGNITICVRKISDGTVGDTLGTWPIESFPQGVNQTLNRRARSNGYNIASGDLISIEFPSNAVNGLEIGQNSTASDPTNYTSRSWNGSVWSAALTDPLAIQIKS